MLVYTIIASKGIDPFPYICHPEYLNGFEQDQAEALVLILCSVTTQTPAISLITRKGETEN